MPLLNAKCPNCGALLNIDDNSDLWFCGYCGSKFKVQDAINQYNITNHINANVVNIIGNNSHDENLNRLISKIDSCMKLKQPLHIVLPLCDKLIEEYPDESIAWWKNVQVFLFWSSQQYKSISIDLIEDKRRVFEKYNNAIALCQDKKTERQMEHEWMNFWEEAARNIISGQWVFYFNQRIFILYEREMDSYVPLVIQEMLRTGVENAKVLEKYAIGVQPIEFSNARQRKGVLRKKSLCNIEDYSQRDKFEIVYALGKTICTKGNSGNDFDEGYRTFIIENPIKNAAKEAASILKNEEMRIQNLISNGTCPCCNGKLRKSFFHKICAKCGKQY